jgi:hypothetical protein
MKKTHVYINVNVTTNVSHTLVTSKSKEEVIADIKNRGVAILDDMEYDEIDYEISLESIAHNIDSDVFYDVEGEEFVLDYKDDSENSL